MTTIGERIETVTEAQTLPDWWRWEKFGKVVRNVDVSVRNPVEQGIERYLGLEHIDPESLHIKRWGQIADGITFTRKFTPGQTLFGKRRAYQRKVAVAEFEGVCSGDILVFEPANDDLIPELLPFIVQSEGFFQHALGTSAGSLSPRTRWRDLAKYTFALPPIDEQRRIAEILWAAEDTLQQHEVVSEHVSMLRRTLLADLTGGQQRDTTQCSESPLGRLPTTWRVAELGDLLDICQYGSSAPLSNEGRHPVFRMMNLVGGLVVENDMKFGSFTEAEFATYRLEPGDILFNRTNSIDLVGKVGIYLLSGEHAFASYLIRLRVRRDMVMPMYLNYYLNSERAQKKIASLATPGVSQANINASNLKRILIPVPPIAEQHYIVDLMTGVEAEQQSQIYHVSLVRNARRQLLHTLLTDRV